MNRSTPRLLSFPLGAALLVLPACGMYYADWEFEVRIDDDVDMPDGGTLIVQANDGGSRPSFGGEEFTIDPGQRVYSGGRELASWSGDAEEWSFFAYVDLNENGDWEDPEPWGADAENPVSLRRRGHESTITVRNDTSCADYCETAVECGLVDSELSVGECTEDCRVQIENDARYSVGLRTCIDNRLSHLRCVGAAECSDLGPDGSCDDGSGTVSSPESVAMACECNPTTHTICAPDAACYWTPEEDFDCLPMGNSDIQDPCENFDDCVPGMICVDADLLPACEGDSCCTAWCRPDFAEDFCDSEFPGATCQPWWENGNTPPGGPDDLTLCL